MSLPEIYRDAALRCITPVCSVRNRVGLAFEQAGATRPLRLAIARDDAAALHAALGDYLARCACQSVSSSGNPNCEGLPHDGQNVAPAARSSAAAAGRWYEPSPSSSNMACQRPSRDCRIQKVPARVSLLKATMLFMVRALSMGGWWNSHSREVPRAASQAPAAIKNKVREGSDARTIDARAARAR